MLSGWRDVTARRPWRISAKLLIISSVVTVIGFSAICVNVMLDMRRGEEALARQTLENLATTIESDIGRNIEIYDLSLRAVASNMLLPELATVSRTIRHLILFDHATTARHFGAVQVFDAEGRLIIDASTLDPLTENRSEEDYFTVHRDNPGAGLFISRPMLFRGAYSIVLSRRISDTDGGFLGVVAGSIRFSYFHELFERLNLDAEDTITVLKRDRTIMMRRPFDLDIIGTNLNDRRSWKADNLRVGASYSGQGPVDPAPRLYVRSGDSGPLFVVAGKPLAAVFALWQKEALRIGAVALLLALFVLGSTLVLSRNSHAFVALRFALARIGAVLVPINFMLHPDEINFILKSSGAKLLATGPDFVEPARAASARDCAVEKMIWLPGEDPATAPAGLTAFDDLLDADGSFLDASVDSRDLAQIVYTSGTESLPKGAMLTHEAVMWQYVSCIIDGGMSAADKFLHALPLYHCAQLDVFLGPQVYLGASGVITGKPTADNILALIQAHKITSFFAPPTIWIAMLRSPNFDKTDLSTLQKGYYGASIMPVEVLLELQRRLPNVKFWNFYGQTEIAPLATVLPPEDQLRKAGSAGKPVLNVETRVVNTAMEDVEVGEVGEIVHRSPHLLSGYYNDPVKTAAAFSGGWFHSGDLATVDDEGHITVVDRVKDMIKTGGENVASREVEEMVYRIPAVSEVAVVGLPDPRWIEAVTAIVVVKSGEKLDEDAVIKHCAGQMAHFKVPKRVIFVDSLPKNPSGKLLKRELRQRFVGGETLDKAIQKNFGT